MLDAHVLKIQENMMPLHKKPVSCVKSVYRKWEDLRIGKKCVASSARFFSKHETCTSGGKISERNSGVEIWKRHHEIIFRDALQHIYHPNGNKGCIYYTN